MSDRRPVTAAVVALLEATGEPVGDHQAPVEVPGKGWWTVYSIPGGEVHDDNLQADEWGMDVIYQVSSAGRRRDQAEWMADLARTTLTGRTSTGAFQEAWPAMTGVKVADRRLWGGLGGVEPSGKAPHEVWSVAERFLIRLTRT